MDPASGSQLEGTANTMKDVFRLLVTACERSRECAVDVSKIRAQGGTRPGAQEVDAERALSDVLSLAKQKAKGLESTLRELSVRQGPSEGALSEEERTRRLSELLDQLLASFLDSLGQFYSSSAEHLASRVSRHGVVGSEGSEVTMQWLSAAQANNTLRAAGRLSRNELRYLVRANYNERLPYPIMEQLSSKVHQFMNMYMLELKKLSSSSASYKLSGGFHLHPTLIEQALQDCCSDWEAKSAGALPTENREERRMQILMDVPKTNLKVDSTSFGPAMEGGRDQNIAEKENAIRSLVSHFANASVSANKINSQAIDDFTSLVLLHTCPSVTNAPCKVAVQLLYGVADFIQVVPVLQKEGDKGVEVRIRKNEKLEVTSHSTWGLSMDSRLLGLTQWPMDNGYCSVVEVKQVQEFNIKKFMENIPQTLPRLTVSLIQPPEDLPLHNKRWSSRPVWPLEVPTTPPDNEFPLTSPTSTGLSNSEEEEQSEDHPLGQGQFTRVRPLRGKRSKGGQRTRDTTSSDSSLMHSSSDSTLPKDGSSRCSSPGSSDSDDAKTEDTATTMTLLHQMDSREPGIDRLMSVLTPGSGLTQKQLQIHSEKKKDKPGSTTRHLVGESSAAREVVRRARREDTREKESPGTVPRNHMLQQSIDLLSYDVNSLERVSPSSGYQSPANLSSRGGSFRSNDGGGDWNPFGARGDLGMGFPAHPGGGGSGFQPSMDQQRRGGARSAVDQWPDYAHQQRYHPPYKSTSTASLPLLTDQRPDSEAGSMYSPSPWSEIDEEYDPKLNEPDFQGSDTSISAHKFREKQASLPHQAGPPGMMRSRSLEDMRKVGPSPAIGSPWDSVQSLAAIGVHSERHFPDPSDQRSRHHNHSQPHSRETSVDREMRAHGMQPPPPCMQRLPGRNFSPIDMPMQYHPNFLPEHHPMQYRDFSPGPPPPGQLPPGPPPPGPPPPGPNLPPGCIPPRNLPPGPNYFRGGPPMPPYYPGHGPMPYFSRGPPPRGMGPGGQPPWEQQMFQPIYSSSSPYGPSPSPQPRPTPPETPPGIDRPFDTRSPHPRGSFNGPPGGNREPMMQQPPYPPRESPRRFPPHVSPGPPGSGGPQGDRWRYRY